MRIRIPKVSSWEPSLYGTCVNAGFTWKCKLGRNDMGFADGTTTYVMVNTVDEIVVTLQKS